MTWWSMADSSAESVPGRRARNTSAVRATGVTRVGDDQLGARSRARQM